MLRKKWLIPQRGNLMNSLKRIAAAALSAALCFSIAVPAYADHYQTPKSIKGVLINEHAQIPDVLEVGASQVVLNFPMSWAFSSQLSVCQDLYTKLDQAGVTVTLIVLNDWAAASYSPSLLPVSQPTGASYYAFNTLNDAGVQSIRDAAKCVTEAFKDCVSNWVIGNEINDGQAWNYIGQMDIDTYCSNYATGFRTWYDTIKGSNKLANVYIPFDFRWNCGQVEGFKYGAMDMIPRLNSRLKDTDYGIAWHAYPETFEDPVFTDDIYTLEKADTYIINLKNFHILTDYMQQADMLSPAGKVRHLILSEQGFTSDSPAHNGQCLDLQAQCIKEAYETAKANPYVEAFLLNRMKDEQRLLDAHYAFGLIDVNGNKKPSFEVYKNLQ